MNDETFAYPEKFVKDIEALTLALLLEGQYKKHFLNGFSIWQYIRDDVFCRLGKYLGHGICYEASAAIMLCLKKYQSVRLVFADCIWNEETGERTKHAFVEINFQDAWWVIDPMWTKLAMPVRREIYYSAFSAIIERWIFYDEFWRHGFAHDSYNQIKTPENQYFLQLILFRRVGRTDRMIFEYKPEILDGGPAFVFNTFGKEYPISQRVLCEFFARPSRLAPKRKTCRRIQSLIRAIPPA